jgi:hypothetical protein
LNARATIRWYQAASRVWLTAAALSLLLPEPDRLGVWLPLHLALAGAVSTAIAGAMQNFALTLTASPGPPGWVVGVQFAGVTAGAAMIALGYPTGRSGLVAAGGAVFVAAALVLGGWCSRVEDRPEPATPPAARDVSRRRRRRGRRGGLGALVGSRPSRTRSRGSRSVRPISP